MCPAGWGAPGSHRELWEVAGWEGTCGEPPAQAGPPGARVMGTPPGGFRTFPKRELHTLPGQLLQCSATLKVKKFFLMVRWSFLAIAPHPVPGTTQRILAAFCSGEDVHSGLETTGHNLKHWETVNQFFHLVFFSSN